MADRPVAKLLAALSSEDGKQRYVEIGQLWLTKSGNLAGRIDAEPIEWRDPKVTRSILVAAKGEDIVLKKQQWRHGR